MLNEIDLSRADLNLLVLFEVVLEEGNVGRAAARLNLTASAVSHGLGRLRQLLNDPLFLRAPKGVVPTARALELAAPIGEVLAGVRGIIGRAAPFDPATSRRRFMIGAPDGASAFFVSPLLERLRHTAPGIDIGIRQLLPAPARVWDGAFIDLDNRVMDVAVIPTDAVPARFSERVLYDEDFVIAMRAGHRFAKDPSLERFCAMEHLVVSQLGDAYGFVDDALQTLGRSRRVALTVPNFMFALAVVAETDLIAALPRRLVAMHSERFGVVSVDSPLPLTLFPLRVIAPRPALMDEAIRWLIDLLVALTQAERDSPTPPPRSTAPSPATR